jgi:HlyD family secretion protein
MRNVFAFAAIAVALTALAGCKPKAEAVAPIYDSAPVEKRNIEVTVDASGVIEPESLVEVKSKASGEVLAVHAETGDVVQANFLLVEIDKRTPKNRLAETEAALVAARARAKIAETQMNRAQALFKSQTLTQADVEQTELEYAQAKSMVVSAEVAVENARITLEDTDVRAPVTGTIIEKNVEPGIVITSPTQAVSGGTVLMKMADLTSVQVRTRVDETDIGKIQPGMPTRVTVSAYPNQPFDGKVLKIEPQAIVEQNVTMFAVLIKLANPGGVLKPGMNADVEIQIGKRDSVAAVPTAALRADSDIALSAQMLGMDEAALRQQLWPDGKQQPHGGGAGKNVLSLNGREIELPEGVNADSVTALMAKRRSGQELTDEERALMRQVFQQAGGGFAGRNGSGTASGGPSAGGPSAGGSASGGRAGGPPGGGGGFPPGGFPPGGFPGGGGPFFFGGGNAQPAPARATNYQFGGDYWVVAVRGDKTVPVAVKTGLTDLEYSEVLAGLEPGDEVLLLPSTSLFEQQERLQQFITQRFGASTPFNQQPRDIPRMFR